MDPVIAIAQQLYKEGKIPTTALLKARLPKDIPLPIIIQRLQKWKENPQQSNPTAESISADTESKEATSIDALLDAKIKQAVAPLIDQIDELKAEIATLQKQLTTEDKS
jgi:hypothetical protein